MKTNRYRLICLLLCLFLIALPGCAEGETAPKNEASKGGEYLDAQETARDEYRISHAYVGDFTVSFQVDTRVDSALRSYLYWPHGGDKYGTMLVKEGDEVKKGDKLCTYEVGITEADILEREMALSSAESSRSEVYSSYQLRISEKTGELSGLSGHALDAASSELEALRAEYYQEYAAATYRVNNAQKALDTLKERREKNYLEAPFDGIIGYANRYFREGEYVNVNQPAVIVASYEGIIFSFTNTNVYGNVPYMSAVTLEDLRTQKIFQGRVVSCADVTGDAEDVVVVEVTDPYTKDDLMGAIRVRGTILEKKSVLLIDSKALRKEGNQYYVLLLREGSLVSKTYVKVGAEQGGVVWITEGLSEGDVLILE